MTAADISLDTPVIELYDATPVHLMERGQKVLLLGPGGDYVLQVGQPFNPSTSRMTLVPVYFKFAEAPQAGTHVKHGTYMFRVTNSCTKSRLVIEGPYGEGVLPHA